MGTEAALLLCVQLPGQRLVLYTTTLISYKILHWNYFPRSVPSLETHICIYVPYVQSAPSGPDVGMND